MAEDPSAPKEPLDVKRVHHLVRLMRRYDLTALDLSDSAVQIRLRRRGADAAAPRAAPPHPSDLAAPTASQADSPPEARPESVPTSVSAAPKTIVIESPMVGTYFLFKRTRRAAVCLGRIGRPCRHNRLHHRGDEGLHGYSGRRLRERSPRSWSRTGNRWSLVSLCSA